MVIKHNECYISHAISIGGFGAVLCALQGSFGGCFASLRDNFLVCFGASLGEDESGTQVQDICLVKYHTGQALGKHTPKLYSRFR